MSSYYLGYLTPLVARCRVRARCDIIGPDGDCLCQSGDTIGELKWTKLNKVIDAKEIVIKIYPAG